MASGLTASGRTRARPGRATSGTSHGSIAARMSELQQMRQPERDRRNIGDQHQYEKHDAVERPDAAHDLLHRHLAHGATHEKNRTHGGMAETDAEVEQHDHPEVNRIDAEAHDDG